MGIQMHGISFPGPKHIQLPSGNYMESTTDGSTEGLHKYINYGRHRPLNTTDSTEDHDLFRYPTQLRMAKSASINSPELSAMPSSSNFNNNTRMRMVKSTSFNSPELNAMPPPNYNNSAMRMVPSASINSPELNAMSSTNLTLPPPKFSVAMKSLSMESLELPENAVTTTTSKGLPPPKFHIALKSTSFDVEDNELEDIDI